VPISAQVAMNVLDIFSSSLSIVLKKLDI